MSGIPSWARPGVRVVCVATAEQIQHGRRLYPWANYPDSKAVYTIRGFVWGSDGVARLLLAEIINPPQYSRVGAVEWGFPFDGFRPLVPPKAEAEDIALFKHHLTDARARERA